MIAVHYDIRECITTSENALCLFQGTHYSVLNAMDESKSFIFYCALLVTLSTEQKLIQTSASLGLDKFLFCTSCDL